MNIDIYCFSQVDRRVSESTIDGLGFNLPEFYRHLATNFGPGSISVFFDICPPQQLLEYTEKTKPFLETFDGIDASFFNDAFICGNGLDGFYWSKPDGSVYTSPEFSEVIFIGGDTQTIAERIFADSEDSRLVYHPWGKRNRYIFNHPSHDNPTTEKLNFDDTVSHFTEFHLTDFFQTHGTSMDNNQDAQVYLPTFGGELSISRGGAGVSLVIGRDENVGDDEYASFIQHARKLDLTASPHPHG